MSRPALIGRLLSPFALSNAAIAWSALIGALGVIAFVPEQGATLRDWRSWLVVAVIAQAAFAVATLVLRSRRVRPGPQRVALTLLAAGATRGVAIAVAMDAVGLRAIAVGGVVERAANSALFCLLGGSLIGATLAWRGEFREQYRLLVDRAMLLERAGRDDAVVDREVLASWASIKMELDATLRQASAVLSLDRTSRGLAEASALLTGAVDAHLRPASRAMWGDALPEHPPISTRRLFATALAAWRLPLPAILAFFGVLIGIGSIVRVGVVGGVGFTAVYLAVTGAVLGLSLLAARRWYSRTPMIAGCTLLVLPVLLLGSLVVVVDGHLGVEADRLSEIIVAVQAPITTVLIAMAVEAGRRRQEILDELQARIDVDAIRLLARADTAHDDAQRLSVFMHHSVQSELAALAVQLHEAAVGGDPDTMRTVGSSVLMRISAIEDLDAAVPPWRQGSIGYERIGEIVGAWMGVLDVEVRLPDVQACRRDQWLVATQVIEEGLANAARHGHASRVVIDGRVDDARLMISIADDGSRAYAGPGPGAVGIGTQWLDRIAPGDWTLRHSTTGSTLVVAIR